MTLKSSTTPLVITLLQGGADAFVQGSVLTGLTGNQAYNVRAIYSEIANPATLSAIALDAEISVSITRRSKAAMPLASDTDVIWKRVFVNSFTTSGQAAYEAFQIYVPQLEIPIVEETLFAQLDSTNTGIVNTHIVRLEVEVDTMSAIDRLNLITRSLQ